MVIFLLLVGWLDLSFLLVVLDLSSHYLHKMIKKNGNVIWLS